jgi:hypothetical protein
MTRSTEQIHDDITRALNTDPAELATWNATLGRLWEEMGHAARREDLPAWTVLAAALLADDYERRSRR